MFMICIFPNFMFQKFIGLEQNTFSRLYSSDISGIRLSDLQFQLKAMSE